MKRLLIGAIVVSMFAVLAPAQANPEVQVGTWTCKIFDTPFGKETNEKLLKPKGPDTCQATIPRFPLLPGEFEQVADVSGSIVVQVTDTKTPFDENKPFLKTTRVPIDLGPGGIAYSEGSCGAGFAIGALAAGGKPYDFFYARVGLYAMVVAVNQSLDEVLTGVIVFRPKATVDDEIARCTPGNPAANQPLTINFEGGGVIISGKKL